MAIVYSLHFKKSTEQYVRKANDYYKNKQYYLALDEYKKTISEGYYLALASISSLYICEYVKVDGWSKEEMYREVISLNKELLNHNLREYDYKCAMSRIGTAYEHLDYDEQAYDYYERAEEQGYYDLYIYYHRRGEYNTADKYYDKYSNANKSDPGGIYFDL